MCARDSLRSAEQDPVSRPLLNGAAAGDEFRLNGIARFQGRAADPRVGLEERIEVFEDIIDSGLTLSYLLKHLRSRRPASVEVCALLTKPSRRRADIPCRYVGFAIEDKFVVGYGLDLADQFRALDYIGALSPEAVAAIVDHAGSLL